MRKEEEEGRKNEAAIFVAFSLTHSPSVFYIHIHIEIEQGR
jgi:hypothetical protein